MTGSLEKAYITLVEPPRSLDKVPRLSSLTSKRGLGQIEFMFNPASYTVAKTATWNRQATKGAATVAMPEFIGANPATMTLDMLIDHSEKKTPKVAQQVDLLLSAVVPIPKTIRENRPTPPWAVFGWGSRIPMVAYVSSVTATYTYFTADGTPVRASCSITLEEVPTDPTPKQNPTSGGEHAMRQHTVVSGDTLPSIAMGAYGDSNRWRDIARVNDIDNPLSLPSGTSLLLPHRSDLDEGDER